MAIAHVATVIAHTDLKTWSTNSRPALLAANDAAAEGEGLKAIHASPYENGEPGRVT